jgi:hypothetical protein
MLPRVAKIVGLKFFTHSLLFFFHKHIYLLINNRSVLLVEETRVPEENHPAVLVF